MIRTISLGRYPSGPGYPCFAPNPFGFRPYGGYPYRCITFYSVGEVLRWRKAGYP